MSHGFFKLIQSGSTAKVADAVRDDPSLVRVRDASGVSALLWSIYTGQTVIRDFLLTELDHQCVPLDIFEAAAIEDTARLEALLNAEPEDVTAYSPDGWTPLHLAAAFSDPDSVKLLLAAGANVNAVSKNPQQNQPLHAALALSRNPETIRLLLTHGADPNAIQAGGFTPLFSAATANRRDLAELLLAHGAKTHLRSDQEKTPADFARERGHTEFADWLEAQPV
jgi:uncharacterized protein